MATILLRHYTDFVPPTGATLGSEIGPFTVSTVILQHTQGTFKLPRYQSIDKLLEIHPSLVIMADAVLWRPCGSPQEIVPRPFRFALQLKNAESAEQWRNAGRRAEELGYDVVSMPDHFEEQLAPIPALAAIASGTSKLRLSMFVLANDFRSPVLLAKEVATLDLLSGGRVELGLGAGWNRLEYEQAGFHFDEASVRIDRLAEAVQVLKALFAGKTVHHKGVHYLIGGLKLYPVPVNGRSVPLVLGGGGHKMLALAAREADIVGITTNNQARTAAGLMGARSTFATVREQIRWVSEQAGNRFDELELNVRIIHGIVTDEREAAANSLQASAGLNGSDILRSPFVLIGTTKQIADHLQRLREQLGINYFTVSQDLEEDFAPVVEELSGR